MKNKIRVPIVLSIAGFDGSGGAGIQADTKTISALGAYAANVLTALPVQNTQGVRKIYDIIPEAIDDQLYCIFEDFIPDAVKIGMVHDTKLVDLIEKHLKNYNKPIVFDPVMIATSGDKLINDDTINACVRQLFPLATLITPNLDEVSVLVDRKITKKEQMIASGCEIIEKGAQAVLVKGGHLQEDEITSYLLQKDCEFIAYQSKKINTKNTHGSGCTLSSAIATFLAQNDSLEKAVAKAQKYVANAVASGANLSIGKGNGPLNHFYNPKKLKQYEMDGSRLAEN